MKATLGVLLTIGMSQIMGCANTKYVELSYPPQNQVEIASTEAQPTIPGPRSHIVILAVNDFRETTDRIGHVSGSITNTNSFLTEDNIEVWVHDAIAYELQRSGYEVLDSHNASANVSADRLTANVMKVYCAVYMVYDGEVTLQATLERADEAAAKAEYPVKVNSGLAWATSASALGESLAQALQTAIRDMLRDLGYTD